jgi:hypothetical protein
MSAVAEQQYSTYRGFHVDRRPTITPILLLYSPWPLFEILVVCPSLTVRPSYTRQTAASLRKTTYLTKARAEEQHLIPIMAVSPTATGTDASNTVTKKTVGMTSIFTPPPVCATSWTYEPAVYNNVEPSGLLIQNCETVVDSCFPSQFADSGRQTGSIIYSPGYCPMGYISANVAIDGPTTTAICCYS